MSDSIEELSRQAGRAFKRLPSKDRMPFHHIHFIRIKRTWFFQNRNRHARFADVMHDAGERQALYVEPRKTQMQAECRDEAGHDKRMLVGVAVMPANGLYPCRQAVSFKLAHDRSRRILEYGWLQCGAPHAR